ncbi:MAG: hypothetical protein ACXABY_00965 [Candidatus Thorarchaeota archaeon]|jgi:hypothetical protein
MKSILKIHPESRRINETRGTPIPVEMLPKMNRICGKIGHRWEVIGDRKKCTRYLCEVTRAYKPNTFVWSEKMQANLSAYGGEY